MRVMIDGLNLSLKKGTGVSTYARNLAKMLGELGHEVDILYAIDMRKNHNELMQEVSFFEGQEARSISETRYSRLFFKFAVFIRALFGRLNSQKVAIRGRVESQHFASKLPHHDQIWNCPQVFFISLVYFKLTGKFLKLKYDNPPDIAHWTYPIPIKIVGAKNIYTIHDLVPLKLPFTTLDDKTYYYKLCKKIVADADCVVTVSEHSKHDICDLLDAKPNKVFNTYQSVSIPDKYASVPKEELTTILEKLYQLKYGNYLLFVGAIEPKKNIARLLEAYLATEIDIPLVLVGPDGWLTEQELAIWDPEETAVVDGTVQKSRRIIRLEYVPFSNLINLMRGARCMVFPSLYEGFGLPVLEAMSLGVPVITSNTSSLSEVAGDAAITVDPYDVIDIRKALLKVYKEEPTNDIVEKGIQQANKFSPEKIKERLTKMYDELLATPL
jgi:glycosyltransferase involved in cell wall biosynthesis